MAEILIRLQLMWKTFKKSWKIPLRNNLSSISGMRQDFQEES